MIRRNIQKYIYNYAKLKKNRKVKLNGNTINLNLGAGLNVAKGWYNIDVSVNVFFSKFPIYFLKLLYRFSGSRKNYSKEDYIKILANNKFIYHDLQYGIPLEDNSCDYIYSSHFFEHLPFSKANYLFHEIFRCLKPNGIVRICVPDLSYAVSLYQDGQKKEFLKFFFAEDSNKYENHQFMYDFEMLKENLTKVGFKKIYKRKYQEGEVPDIKILDNRPEETLFVEAYKEIFE